MGYWKNKRVFITGGTGFLGSHLTETLLGQHAQVTLLVRESSLRNPLLIDLKARHDALLNVVEGQLEDYALLASILEKNTIETVFHIGAQTIVGKALKDPLPTFEANIKGTWNLLEACRQAPAVPKVVLSSSDKAYGEPESLPYVEDMPLKGSHPYDVSKSCADMLAYTYYKTYGLPVCITRCSNYFGPGDPHLSRIVPGTILSVLKNEAPVIRSDGTMIRDYFYIKDGVNAQMHLEKCMDDKAIHGEAFNFSNERALTVIELTQLILKLMNREDLKPIILNQANHEIKRQLLSARKAADLLKWAPKHSLDEALLETIAWYKNNQ